MKEVIFYRDHPKDPDNFMQMGQLYRYDRNTKSVVFGEYPKAWVWRKWDRRKFWNFFKKYRDAINFIPVGDRTATLRVVVAKYFEFNDLCSHPAADGIFNITDGSPNRMILAALGRSMATDLQAQLKPRDTEEQHAIREATRGGITFAKKGYQGQGYKYDIVSCYPSVAASPDCMFPIGDSEFVTVQEADPDVPALLKVQIGGEDSCPWFRRPFGEDGTGWMTNVDVQMAIDLGLDVQLVGSPNCLRFEGHVSGKELFGNYFDSLFVLKKEGVPGAKFLLNKTVGLFAIKRYCTYGKGGDRTMSKHPTDDQYEVMSIVPDDSDGFVSKVIDKMDLYSNPKYCIFNCFITAYARQRLVDIFVRLDCADDVVHVHTDGWICSKPLSPLDLPLSRELGGIKLEYEGQVHVHHVNKVRDGEDNKI